MQAGATWKHGKKAGVHSLIAVTLKKAKPRDSGGADHPPGSPRRANPEYMSPIVTGAPG